MSAKAAELNLSFSAAHRNSYNNGNNNGNNNENNNENNNLELNAGDRGASPSSPAIPIPERKYTAEEEAVIDKFVDFIRIQNVNEKPKLTKVEKEILQGMYWSRQFTDRLQRRLNRMGLRKESANLEKNFRNIVSKSRRRSRKQRKTRKA
jgi:hypothetical protein